MQNFGKIKNVFNSILIESIGKEDDTNKGLFKQYVKAINENEILKTQFMVYTNIENKIDESDYKATEYVKANIALLDKFKRKDIVEANTKLAKLILFEGPDTEYKKEKLHEDITKLIFTKKGPNTIDTIVESTSEVVNYIKTNKAKVVNEDMGLPNSMVSSLAVEKFNAKYSNLNEDEKRIFKTIAESSEDEKSELFTSYVRECVDSIDGKLSESDIDEKGKLLMVKDKLLRMSFVSESFVEDISRLVELKSDLK